MPYSMLCSICFWLRYPRNPTGKIEKPKLRKMYGAAGLVAQQNGIAS